MATLDDVVKAIQAQDKKSQEIKDVRSGKAGLDTLDPGQLKQLQSQMVAEQGHRSKALAGLVPGGVSSMLNSGSGTFKSTFAALGGGFSAEGGALAAANPYAAAAAGAVALGKELVELPFKLEEWGRTLLDSQRYLAEFSGSMASVFANADMRAYARNAKLGEETAGSASHLQESTDDLADALEPVQALLTDIKNEALADVIDLIKPLAQEMGEMAKDVRAFLKDIGFLKDRNVPVTGLQEWATGMANVPKQSLELAKLKHDIIKSRLGNRGGQGGPAPGGPARSLIP